MRAPSTTAASEFATPHSASLWVWMPSAAPGRAARTVRTAWAISCGSVAPLVSHSVIQCAPASAATRRHSTAYSLCAAKASKKCSAS